MTPLIRLSAPRLVLVTVLIAATSVPARAATPAEQLATFSAAAAAPAQPMRGRQFFAATHGREWSCASCHGATPTAEGKHAGTEHTDLGPARGRRRGGGHAMLEGGEGVR